MYRAVGGNPEGETRTSGDVGTSILCKFWARISGTLQSFIDPVCDTEGSVKKKLIF